MGKDMTNEIPAALWTIQLASLGVIKIRGPYHWNNLIPLKKVSGGPYDSHGAFLVIQITERIYGRA